MIPPEKLFRWILLLILLALTQCARKPALHPEPSMETASFHCSAGNASLGQGHLQEAADHFNAALTFDPESAPALEGLGLVALERGDLEAAERFFQEGLEKDPEYARLYVGLGRLAASQGKDEEAIEDYQQAIRMDPAEAEAYYRQARSYINLGQYSLAEESFKKTLDRDPGHSGAKEEWAALARSRSSPDDLPPEYIIIVEKPVINRADFAAILVHQLSLDKICQHPDSGVIPDDAGNSWARKEISNVITCDLMTVSADGDFRPREMVTRRMCARILSRILITVRGGEGQMETPGAAGTGFPDVADDDEDLKAILLVTSLGIMSPRGNGNFDPDGELDGYSATRAVRALRKRL